jgi:hypothetical protein
MKCRSRFGRGLELDCCTSPGINEKGPVRIHLQLNSPSATVSNANCGNLSRAQAPNQVRLHAGG